jgi:hypothetical protein
VWVVGTWLSKGRELLQSRRWNVHGMYMVSVLTAVLGSVHPDNSHCVHTA